MTTKSGINFADLTTGALSRPRENNAGTCVTLFEVYHRAHQDKGF
jgi:hypothetical protein